MNNKLRIIAITSALLATFACKSKDGADTKTEPTTTEPTTPTATDVKEPEVVPETKVASTEEVLDHHLAAFGAANMDDILADYADDAMLVTPMGVIKGKDGLKGVFEGLFKEFSHADAKFTMGKKTIDGQVAYITWSADTAENAYELATDTFLIVEGKIVAQTFAGKITPKATPDDKAPPAKDEPVAEGPTQKVLAHHLGAFGERKMDDLLSDYTADSVFIGQAGVLKGAEGVKPMFEGLFTEFAKKGVEFNMGKMVIEGDVALITWSAKTPDNSYDWATDTFIIRDGKIVYQTLAAMVTPAKG
jgi:ketosteroid isomerase-like protein